MFQIAKSVGVLKNAIFPPPTANQGAAPMNKNPYDENRPDLYAIQDQFNSPEMIALWRAGLFPEQIKEREEREAKERKRKDEPPHNG